MVDISEGVKLRAQIDGEVVRGLMLANGGGAVALIALLPNLLDKYPMLARWTLWGLLGMFLGLAFAIVHNRYRRHCSLAFETAWRGGRQPAPGFFWWFQLSSPVVCWLSELFMRLSAIGFIAGGLCVLVGGLKTLP